MILDLPGIFPSRSSSHFGKVVFFLIFRLSGFVFPVKKRPLPYKTEVFAALRLIRLPYHTATSDESDFEEENKRIKLQVIASDDTVNRSYRENYI